jgi:two-component system sensor histidine kinase TctE
MEIAHLHNATVAMEDTRPGQSPPGARFNVRFVAESGTAVIAQ